MYGSSYMAATQIQAAATAPPSLVEICPAQAGSDYYEGRTYRGGAFELGALVCTSLGAMCRLALDTHPAASRHRRSIRRILNWLSEGSPVFPLRDVLDGPDAPLRALTPWFFDWAEHVKPDEYWQALSVESSYADMGVPALHLTGWYDQFHVGTLRNYEGLRRTAATSQARDGQYLMVGPWCHTAAAGASIGTARVGDSFFGIDAAPSLDTIQRAWLRRTMLDEPTAFRQRSRVRLFVMGANVWRDEDEWPLARARPTKLFLTASNVSKPAGLSWGEPVGTTGHRSYAYDPRYPVPTAGGAHLMFPSLFLPGPVDQRAIETRPDVLSYDSPPLGEAVEVTGWVSCCLTFASDAPSTDVTARLVDAYPGGPALGICDGVVRLSGLEAGVPTVAEIDLGATSHVFGPGHVIRLDVSSSNFPRFDPNPNNGASSFDTADPRIARQTIFDGAEVSSYVVLPIVSTQPS
jgi:hypothetical protein